MFDELFKSIRATLYDRASSPLLGSFIVSWLVWNHRMIMVIFSGMSVTEKFSYIDTVLYQRDFWYYFWRDLFCYPLFTAIAFILLYPYPAKWVYHFSRYQNKLLKDVKKAVEGSTLLTLEESNYIRRQMDAVKEKSETELKRKDNEIVRIEELYANQIKANREIQEQLDAERTKPPYKKATQPLQNNAIEAILQSGKFILVHNPNKDSSKVMKFGKNGVIEEGGNKLENTWRVSDGVLEFVQEDGKVHSRFWYKSNSKMFINTDEDDTLSARGQYMYPEHEGVLRRAVKSHKDGLTSR